MPAPRRAAIACALAALAIAITVVVATLREGGRLPSALVRMDATEPMARFARAADPSFRFQAPDSHYDGVYFYAVAMDPLALGEQARSSPSPPIATGTRSTAGSRGRWRSARRRCCRGRCCS
ncbi:MAG: hypothetical protein U0869_19990 [Chloroflexota bacterium]